MRVPTLIILLLLSLTTTAEDLPMMKPESVGFSSERLQQIDKFAERHIEEGLHQSVSRQPRW